MQRGTSTVHGLARAVRNFQWLKEDNANLLVLQLGRLSHHGQ